MPGATVLPVVDKTNEGHQMPTSKAPTLYTHICRGDILPVYVSAKCNFKLSIRLNNTGVIILQYVIYTSHMDGDMGRTRDEKNCVRKKEKARARIYRRGEISIAEGENFKV